MNKYLVIFMSHDIDDFIIDNYNKLKSELPDGYDIIWYLDDVCDKELPEGIRFIKHPHKLVIDNIHFNKIGWKMYNPTKYCEIMYDELEWFKKYDYYWFIEWDVYFNGSWKDFFSTIDKSHNEDLITSYISKHKHKDGWYMWRRKIFNTNPHFYYQNKHIDLELDGDYIQIKSLNPVFRLSNNGLKIIKEYNYDNLKYYNHELYIPTIIYNAKLKIISLEQINSDEEFISDLNYIDSVKDYNWDVDFKDVSEMNKPLKLFCNYKGPYFVRTFD